MSGAPQDTRSPVPAAIKWVGQLSRPASAPGDHVFSRARGQDLILES
jgi:hypothetical protein